MKRVDRDLGARVVAHDCGVERWTPDKTEKLPEIEIKAGGYKHQHVIYLWRVGSK